MIIFVRQDQNRNNKNKTDKIMKTTVQNISDFLGNIVSFNNSIKLYHWHVSGEHSYAQHIALDQALDALLETADRIVETQYALNGDLDIVVPQTSAPKDIVKHVEDFYNYLEAKRELFEEAFTQAIIDDAQEALQQLLYRLKRLK